MPETFCSVNSSFCDFVSLVPYPDFFVSLTLVLVFIFSLKITGRI
jgi:hypothetical protein